MSKIFGGKIPGLDAPIDTKISIPKIEKNIFDRQIAALDMKFDMKLDKKLNVFNKKLPELKMPAFQDLLSKKTKREDIFGAMTKTFKKKQRQFLPNKMKMTLNGGSFKDMTKTFEQKMLFNRMIHPEKIARTRLKTQKKLDLFGDYDKDGVMNIFDCRPKMKKWQGPFDNNNNSNLPMVPEYPIEPYQEPIEIPAAEEEEEEPTTKVVTGVTEEESVEEPAENIVEAEYTIAGEEPATERIKKFVGQKVKDIGEILAVPEEAYAESEKEPEIPSEPKPGVFRRAGEALGIVPTAEQVAEREELAGIRREARKEAVAELEKQKIKDILTGEKQKVKEEYRKEVYKTLGIAPSPIYQAARGVSRRPGRLARGMETLQTGVRTSTMTLSEGIGAALPGASQKITDLIGLGSGRGLAMGYFSSTGRGLQMGFLPGMEPPVEMPTAPPSVIAPTPVTMAPSAPAPHPTYRRTVETTEGRIMSPYSKRPVRYTRGPYRKRFE